MFINRSRLRTYGVGIFAWQSRTPIYANLINGIIKYMFL